MDKFSKIALLVLSVSIAVLLLLFFFQPTNVIVAGGQQQFYMSLFGWLGFLLSLPAALLLVKPEPGRPDTRTALILHQAGVWGTRACIVFIVYMLFAVGGYLLPKHLLNLTASETYREEVKLIEYRLAATEPVPYQKGKFRFNNEFLVIRRANGKKLPLLINNLVGTNKLDFHSIVPVISAYSQLRINGTASVVLVGRKNSIGRTFDALKLR